jgi:hypothetical protein
MRGPRVYPAVLVVVAVALGGCGGTAGPSLAPPAQARTIELGWVERFPAARFTLRVEQLVVGDDGWRARISVENHSTTPYRLDERSVGLVLLDTDSRAELRRLTANLTHAPPALKPERASPTPPPALGPGATWNATISGPEVLREGSVVRVLFGPFSPAGERFRSEVQSPLWVTDHSVRL